MQKNNHDLFSCPCCGSFDTRMEYLSFSKFWKARCNDCGLETPPHPHQFMAQEIFNRRPRNILDRKLKVKINRNIFAPYHLTGCNVRGMLACECGLERELNKLEEDHNEKTTH